MTCYLVLMSLVIIKLTGLCFDRCNDTGSQEGSRPDPGSPEQKERARSCTSSAAVWWMSEDNGHREASHCHHHTTATNSELTPDILHCYWLGYCFYIYKGTMVLFIDVCIVIYVLSTDLPPQTPTPSQPTPVRYSHPVGHKIITLTQFKQQIKHLPQVRHT